MNNIRKKVVLFFMVGSLGLMQAGASPHSTVKAHMQGKDISANHAVKKYTLKNGMTILVYSTHTIPKVSIQIWYKVGSKDESTGEKGIAHLIEHMIFKGTAGKDSLNLSESDINMLGNKLSASMNAFTTQDFTGYKFDLPTQNWKQVLPVIADCMLNCAFKDEHLNSEMKAVIQELKMRRDNYVLSLAESMIATMFPDHPYHYPIIGFKQDLWNVNGQDLRKFYKKHYVPNNATLVVVGDVNGDEVVELAQRYFGNIKPDTSYERPEFYLNEDIISKSVTVYRDVSQPTVLLGYRVPGLASKTKHVIDLAALLLGEGKSSRLHKLLVDDCELVTSLSTYHWDILFDHSVFFIVFEPKNLDDVHEIIGLIQKEIQDLIVNGANKQELTRAVNQAKMKYYATLEDTDEQAFDIGKFFLATGDENYVFDYLKQPLNELQNELRDLLKTYFRPSITYTGMVLPLPEQEKAHWLALQEESDRMDAQILSMRQRATPVEEPHYLPKVVVGKPSTFAFPKAKVVTLNNGLRLLYHHNGNTPKIDLILRLKAQDYYDPQDQQGLYNFVTQVMTEGTTNYCGSEYARELESYGMSLSVEPGAISLSMLSKDLKKGLELLLELLTEATFAEKDVERTRNQLKSDVKHFWDDPKSFSGQLVKEHIYKNHPYSKNRLGTAQTIATITREDLIALYDKFIVPAGARLAIVGDLSGYDVPAIVEQTLGKWCGDPVQDISFPALSPAPCQQITHPINRDQVVLCFAQLSVDRKNKDYDKLLIFDQILAGGALGSMSSRLFRLREQSGLFYSISGSLTARADEQPGLAFVKTLVSVDRLNEAEKAIKETLAHVADTIEPYEFEQAKSAILTSIVQFFESNREIAAAFLFLDKYGFTPDYFDTRASELERITIPEVQEAVRKVLKVDDLSVFKIGRVEKSVAAV